MIHVVADLRDPNRTTLTISGHAGFAMRGKDIVCAGISAIFQAALLGIDAIARNRAYSKYVEFVRLDP